MNPAAVARFAQRTAADRGQTFGPLTAPKGLTYGGKCYPVVSVSTISRTRELGSGVRAGGWTKSITTVVRVLRCHTGFVPVEGGVLTLVHNGQQLRIDELRDNVPAEWVLGCVNPESSTGE